MNPNKVAVLIICFALTSIFVYWRSSSGVVGKKAPLSRALSDMEGWRSAELTPLDPRIVEGLELDDYINHTYSNGNETVYLYIGYYQTTKKIGATHSPLVCFPGQGWTISDTQDQFLVVGGHDLHFRKMVVGKGQTKLLALYWYQSFDKTSSGPFLQKLHALWAKLLKRREDNAFVRVSVSMVGKSEDEAFATGVKFIEVVYPHFLKYLNKEI